MTKHRTIVVASLLSAIVVVGGLAYLPSRPPHAVRQFERLAVAMSREDVVAILGPPSPQEQEGLLIAMLVRGTPREIGLLEQDLPKERACEHWWVDDFLVLAFFDVNKALCRAEIYAPLNRPRLLDRLRRWLGV